MRERITVSAQDLSTAEYRAFAQSIVTGMTLWVHAEIHPESIHLIGAVEAFERLEDRRYQNMKKRNYTWDRWAIESWERDRSTSWICEGLGRG